MPRYKLVVIKGNQIYKPQVLCTFS
jgi:hypothetical protein